MIKVFLYKIFRLLVIINFIISLKSVYAQCNFGFDIAKAGPFCPKDENILLTAWDTIRTGGCVIEPGFLFQVRLDNIAQTDNYLDIFVNGIFLQRIDNTTSPTKWRSNIWFHLFADYRRPNDKYLLKFCDKSKNGSFLFKLRDRATKAILQSGTINGADGCVSITVPNIYGQAVFSGPGVTNLTNGNGYFNPAKAGAGTHIIKYYFNNQIGYKDSITKTVVVQEYKISVNNANILKGCSATLLASGAETYKWSNGFKGNPLIVKPEVTTTYTVTGTDASGCQGISSSVVTVDASFVITLEDTTICEGDTAVLEVQGNADNYLWSNGETKRFIKVSPVVSTTYSVSGTIGTCGKDTAVATVKVISKPVVTVSNSEVCPGAYAVLYAYGAKSYKWNSGEISDSIIVNPLVNSTYFVTGTDTNGCRNIASGKVTIIPPPTSPIISSNSPICNGDAIFLFAEPADTIKDYSYFWSGPDNFSSDLQNPIVNNTNIKNSGIYSAYIIKGYCKSEPSDIEIKVLPNPSNFLQEDFYICDTSLFKLQSKETFSEYLWQDGSNNSYFNSNTPGVYWLKVTDKYGCSGTDTIIIIKSCPSILYVPNAFNPYGSGSNDIFYAFGSNISKFKMDIFDRWGNLIFQTENIANGWDGKYNNKDCPLGVYVYRITYESIRENNLEKKAKIGSVLLLR